jgi:hypothetical protein
MDLELKTGADREAVFRQWLDRHVGLILKIVRGYAVTSQDQDDLVVHSIVSRRIQRDDLDLSGRIQHGSRLATHGAAATAKT